MNDQKQAPTTDDTSSAVLDDSAGTPAVAVGTGREQAEQRPATVRDTASPDAPDVAAGTGQ